MSPASMYITPCPCRLPFDHWADGEVDVSWYQEDRRVGEGVRWNAGRSKAYRLIRGTKKEELSLDEAYVTAEKLGLNLEKFDSGIP